MTYATLAPPCLTFPAISPYLLATIRQRAKRVLAITSIAAQSVTLAAFLWLILAAPGATANHASTIPVQTTH